MIIPCVKFCSHARASVLSGATRRDRTLRTAGNYTLWGATWALLCRGGTEALATEESLALEESLATESLAMHTSGVVKPTRLSFFGLD